MEKNKTAVFLCRPHQFKLNEETAIDNRLQKSLDLSLSEINQNALLEFDQLVEKIRSKIETIVFQDTPDPETPDSIFPNNWFSTENNEITLYPMKAANRRKERKDDALSLIQRHLPHHSINDLTQYEKKDTFLEGTGVLVFDHTNKIIYCALSERADEQLAKLRSKQLGYDLFCFNTKDQDGSPIYHTNVMMAVLKVCVVYCEEVIASSSEQIDFEKKIKSSNKIPLKVTPLQMLNFCCNIIQVNNYVLMSSKAYSSFSSEQLDLIKENGEIIHSPLDTIETLGGGGCRCMLTELFQTK